MLSLEDFQNQMVNHPLVRKAVRGHEDLARVYLSTVYNEIKNQGLDITEQSISGYASAFVGGHLVGERIGRNAALITRIRNELGVLTSKLT